MEKTAAQRAFESETSDWGLDYERDDEGAYIDYGTGICFGSFFLGWNAAIKYKEGMSIESTT